MAFSVTMTGTNQTMTVVAGSPNVTFASGVATNWVVGATVQGMSWPAGTKIVSITGTPATSTAAVLSVNYPSTSGSGTVIVSSNNATLTVALNASGDTATPQNIISAGFGLLTDYKTIQIFGRTYVELRISQGAIYDDTEWTYLFGLYSYMQVNETYTGIWRSGFVPVGDKLIKAKGASLRFNIARAVQGGTSIFKNSGLPSGFPTNKLKVQWNDFVIKSSGGSNYCVAPGAFYAEFDNCGDIIVDAFDDTGANGSFSGSFGSIEKLSMNRIIGGLQTGYDTTVMTTIGKIEWFPIPTFNTSGTNPDIKIGTPNNVPVSGFAPVFHQTNASLEFIGVNTNNTEIIDDYILPTDYPLITNSRNFSAGNRTYRRTVKFQLNDSTGTDLTNVTAYVKSGSNVLANAIQTGDFNQKLNAVFVSWAGRSPASGSYIAPITSLDTRLQSAQFRKYGYNEEVFPYDITNEAYSQPVFMLIDNSLSGIDEANAAAITTAGIDWTAKTITPTSDLTYDQINARIAWELAQTTNSDKTEPRTISGSNLTLATGWSLVVNNGITISAGTNITYLYVPTITINGTGKITGVYATTAGTSTVLEINPPSDGYSLCLYQGTTTKYFASNVTTGSYYVYLSPSEAGTYTLAAENYGQKRTQDTLVLNGGNVWYNITDSEDVGITATKSVAAAYTTLSTTEQIYDATAIFRLSETGIKLGQLVARDGLYLDFGTYNVKIKDDASAIVGVTTGTITYKSIVINEATKYNAMKATPPATITPTDTEIINVLIEDANGDSQLTILGGDNLGYELWKIPTATATDDYATGTLLDTLTTNAETFRFIGISGFDIVGRDVSSGVRRRSSMVKGSYEQAFYVGNQIQLATDAPQLIENNQKLDELILKIDTDLDVPVSTRLAAADYVDPATAQDVWEYTTRTLTSAGASGATLAEIEASTILAKEATSQEIKTKVDTLENADFTITNAKIDEVKAVVDGIENTDLSVVIENQNIINENVKLSSIFVPASTNTNS